MVSWWNIVRLGLIISISAPRPTRRKASGGVILLGMASEPSANRAIVFFDGQNLYHGAKEAFGYTYPNFDPAALARAV